MYKDKLSLTILQKVFEFLEETKGRTLYSDFFDVEGGYAFKSSQYTKDGYFILRVTNISPDGSIDNKTDNKFVNDRELIEELSSYILHENDVLIVMVGGSLGKVGIVPKEILPALLNQNLWRVKNEKGFNSRYVYYLSLYLNEFKAIIKTSSHGHFSRKKYRDLQIPNVIAEESEVIVEYLDNVLLEREIPNSSEFEECSNQLRQVLAKEQALSTINNELSHQLELVRQLRQAFLREAMQGKLVRQDTADEPAEILLEKIKAEKEKLIAEKKIKKDKPLPEIKPEEIPFEIPNIWTWCRLGEIFNEIKYGTSKSCDYNTERNSAVLRIPNVSSGIIDGTDLKYTDLTDEEIQDLALEENDILIIRSNGSKSLVGETALVTKEFVGFAYAGYLIRLRFSKEFINAHYLMSATNSQYFREMIEIPLRTTVGINNINTTEISLFLIPLPPLAEQKRIVEKLEKLMKYCDELESNIRESKGQAESLLQVALKEALEPK